MKRYILIFLIAAVPVTAGLVSCSDSESRMNSVLNQATVVINLAMPEEHTSVSFSITERIFHFFIRDAVAQTAPAAFSSIQVRVTGSDLTPIEKNFNPGAAISFSVPAGTVRTFEVTAVVAPGDPSAAASFRGTSVANLPAGATVNVPVAMKLHEAKIIVPDYNNARLVILDSMAGGWAERQYDTCGDACYLNPSDIDFDARGRIYVIDRDLNDIFRFNSTDLDNPLQLNLTALFGYDYPITALAIDRARNHLYTASGYMLYRTALDGTAPREQLLAGFTEITGLAVAPDGKLIITGYPGSLYRYDPDYDRGAGQWGQIESTATLHINQPMDVIVRNNSIYVANYGGGTDRKILKFPLDFDTFTAPDGYGSAPPSDRSFYGGPGYFYGAQHFISGMKDSLIIIDKGYYIPVQPLVFVDRLISIQDIEGSGWTSFGSSGASTDQFDFYSYISPFI